MTNAEKQKIIRLREQGLGYTQIANRMGLFKSKVATFCKRNHFLRHSSTIMLRPGFRGFSAG